MIEADTSLLSVVFLDLFFDVDELDQLPNRSSDPKYQPQCSKQDVSLKLLINEITDDRRYHHHQTDRGDLRNLG